MLPIFGRGARAARAQVHVSCLFAPVPWIKHGIAHRRAARQRFRQRARLPLRRVQFHVEFLTKPRSLPVTLQNQRYHQPPNLCARAFSLAWRFLSRSLFLLLSLSIRYPFVCRVQLVNRQNETVRRDIRYACVTMAAPANNTSNCSLIITARKQ